MPTNWQMSTTMSSPSFLIGWSPFAKVTIRKRPFDPWFDDVCRDQKKRARRLERRVHSAKTDVARSLRRAEWLEGLRQYGRTLNTRRSEFWLQTMKTQRS